MTADAHHDGRGTARLQMLAGMDLVAMYIVGLFLMLVPRNLVFLSGPMRPVMAILAGCSAVLALAISRLAARKSEMVYVWASLLAGIVLTNGIVNLILSQDLVQTTNIMLTMVAVGATFLDRLWRATAMAVVLASWAVVTTVITLRNDAQPLNWVIAISMSTVVAWVIGEARLSTVLRLEEAWAAAEQAAVSDSMTGLLNRRGLALLGDRMLATARRQGDAVHAIFLDVDGLKAVNDQFGHEAGDEVLRTVADMLKTVARATDVCCRWAGDEFCVVGPGPGMRPSEMQRRLSAHLAALVPTPGGIDVRSVWPGEVTVGGAVLNPWDAGELTLLVQEADADMYSRRAARRGPQWAAMKQAMARHPAGRFGLNGAPTPRDTPALIQTATSIEPPTTQEHPTGGPNSNGGVNLNGGAGGAEASPPAQAGLGEPDPGDYRAGS